MKSEVITGSGFVATCVMGGIALYKLTVKDTVPDKYYSHT